MPTCAPTLVRSSFPTAQLSTSVLNALRTPPVLNTEPQPIPPPPAPAPSSNKALVVGGILAAALVVGGGYLVYKSRKKTAAA
jgi:LPXTG-motif cell wall-anchored protein